MRSCLYTASFCLFAAPALAGNLQFFESTQGAPGVTANFPSGTQLVADIDFDADSAEGGGLLQGATEIEFRPTGSAVFVDFVCHFNSCFRNVDYVFEPGDSVQGARLLVSDPDFQPKNGIFDMGALTFDSVEDPGSVDLVDCNYTGQDGIERSCNPFVVVSLPEPDALAALLAGALLLGASRGRKAAVR